MNKTDKNVIYLISTLFILALFINIATIQYVESWFLKINFAVLVSAGLCSTYANVLVLSYQVETEE